MVELKLAAGSPGKKVILIFPQLAYQQDYSSTNSPQTDINVLVFITL